MFARVPFELTFAIKEIELLGEFCSKVIAMKGGRFDQLHSMIEATYAKCKRQVANYNTMCSEPLIKKLVLGVEIFNACQQIVSETREVQHAFFSACLSAFELIPPCESHLKQADRLLERMQNYKTRVYHYPYLSASPENTEGKLRLMQSWQRQIKQVKADISGVSELMNGIEGASIEFEEIMLSLCGQREQTFKQLTREAKKKLHAEIISDQFEYQALCEKEYEKLLGILTGVHNLYVLEARIETMTQKVDYHTTEKRFKTAVPVLPSLPQDQASMRGTSKHCYGAPKKGKQSSVGLFSSVRPSAELMQQLTINKGARLVFDKENQQWSLELRKKPIPLTNSLLTHHSRGS